ncbi:hypothetical protein PybrP1_001754 [[Pythium] brassicae (nom. inval.)]|nr:hypothetical protein PybrP1_001754 [[Pythium] brassicae (nom. inval.)]
MRRHPLVRECIAEFIGTWLMIFLGLSTGAASVTTGMQSGFWQVAVVWGFAIALASFLTAHISGAHLNPAVTISLAYSRAGFPKRKVLPYTAAQMLGAMAASASVLAVYGSAIARFETRNRITRGDANSTLSAMLFGEYFPNPQLVKSGVLEQDDVTTTGALLAEALGTMLLVVLIRALTDEANHARPTIQQVPFFVGFMVACLASFLAPLSQAGFNPARDFGPQFYDAFWGSALMVPSNVRKRESNFVAEFDSLKQLERSSAPKFVLDFSGDIVAKTSCLELLKVFLLDSIEDDLASLDDKRGSASAVPFDLSTIRIPGSTMSEAVKVSALADMFASKKLPTRHSFVEPYFFSPETAPLKAFQVSMYRMLSVRSLNTALPRLRTLRFGRPPFSHEHVAAICSVLRSLPHLKDVDLSVLDGELPLVFQEDDVAVFQSVLSSPTPGKLLWEIISDGPLPTTDGQFEEVVLPGNTRTFARIDINTTI